MNGRNRLLLVCALVSLGCSSRSDSGTSTGGDGGAPNDAPSLDVPAVFVPATTCLTGQNCVTDRDCPSGSHCNQGLQPPACQTLYCGLPGTICSEDAQCRTSSRCIDGACVACTMCGSSCTDLNRDPFNCGSCGQRSLPLACINGQPGCATGTTLCGGECVDLQTDSRNCGACAVSAGAGQRCVAGQVVCRESLTSCGTYCADVRDNPYDCGACHLSCLPGSCSRGTCSFESTTRQSCDAACNQRGMVCLPGRYETLYDGYTGPRFECDQVPPAIYLRQNFQSIRCVCGPPSS